MVNEMAKNSTYWLIDGERYDNLTEAEAIVERDDIVAEEITPEQQIDAAALIKLQADESARTKNAVAAWRAEQEYNRSPEGQRDTAQREGGRVTIVYTEGDAPDDKRLGPLAGPWPGLD